MASKSLMTPVEVSLWVTRTAFAAGWASRAWRIVGNVNGGPPLKIQAGDGSAHSLGHVGVAAAKGTGDGGYYLVAGGEGVDQRGFKCPVPEAVRM